MFPLGEDGVLRTQRLVLRPLSIADKADLLRLFTWNVVQWLAAPPWPYTEQDADEWLGSKGPWDAAGDKAPLAVTFGDAFVGTVTVNMEPASASQSGPGPHLGYWIGEAYWGRGFVTEASQVVIARAFAAKDFPYFYSGAFSDNARSLRAQEKLGFVRDFEGEILSRPSGKARPHVSTVLSRERWERQARR